MKDFFKKHLNANNAIVLFLAILSIIVMVGFFIGEKEKQIKVLEQSERLIDTYSEFAIGSLNKGADVKQMVKVNNSFIDVFEKLKNDISDKYIKERMDELIVAIKNGIFLEKKTMNEDMILYSVRKQKVENAIDKELSKSSK